MDSVSKRAAAAEVLRALAALGQRSLRREEAEAASQSVQRVSDTLALLGCFGGRGGLHLHPSTAVLHFSKTGAICGAGVCAGALPPGSVVGGRLDALRVATGLLLDQRTPEQAEMFSDITAAMRGLGFSAKEAGSVWAVAQGVSALLSTLQPADSAQTALRVSAVAHLWNVSAAELSARLGKGRPVEALVVGLAEEMYSALFHWLARKALPPAGSGCATVSVAIAPGIDCHAAGAGDSEDFARGYISEALQALHDEAVFELEPRAAAADGVDVGAPQTGSSASAACRLMRRAVLQLASGRLGGDGPLTVQHGHGSATYSALSAQQELWSARATEPLRSLLRSSTDPVIAGLVQPRQSPAEEWLRGVDAFIAALRSAAQHWGLHWIHSVTSHPIGTDLWDGPYVQAQIAALRVAAVARRRCCRGSIRVRCAPLSRGCGGHLRLHGLPRDVASAVLLRCGGHSAVGHQHAYLDTATEGRLVELCSGPANRAARTVQAFVLARNSRSVTVWRKLWAATTTVQREARLHAARHFSGTLRTVTGLERHRAAATASRVTAQRHTAEQLWWEELRREELVAEEQAARAAVLQARDQRLRDIRAPHIRELESAETAQRRRVEGAAGAELLQVGLSCEADALRVSHMQLQHTETRHRGRIIRSEIGAVQDLTREHAYVLLGRSPAAVVPEQGGAFGGGQAAERTRRWLVADNESRARKSASAVAAAEQRSLRMESALRSEQTARLSLRDAERSAFAALIGDVLRSQRHTLERDEGRHPELGRSVVAAGERRARGRAEWVFAYGAGAIDRGKAEQLELDSRSTIERNRRSDVIAARHRLLSLRMLWLEGPVGDWGYSESRWRHAIAAMQLSEWGELVSASEYGVDGAVFTGRRRIGVAAAEEAARDYVSGKADEQRSCLVRSLQFNVAQAGLSVIQGRMWQRRAGVEAEQKRARSLLESVYGLLRTARVEQRLRSDGVALEQVQRTEARRRVAITVGSTHHLSRLLAGCPWPSTRSLRAVFSPHRGGPAR
eukprot:TRINITY_DN21114_c0_g1_i2.p1 TRINITY_DN21114_c0_g1~~TRINITY_DN21114_c0_g1_i2.p1  ORF type:complete len:1020 (+),score=257.91 TRINITY_DN21114_c0_g1_i2:493-3552(+)